MKQTFGLCVVFCVLCNLCKAYDHMHYSCFKGENGIRIDTTYSVTPTPGGSFTGGHFYCIGATGKVVVAQCHSVYRSTSDKTQMYGYVELLESGCFQDQSVTSVWINANIKTLPEKSFYNCSDLLEVVLPTTLETIDTNAFGECTSLDRVVFRSGLPKGLADSGVLLWPDAIYYPVDKSEGWEKVLRNSGYGGRYGAFRGEDWTGMHCVIPGTGNLKPVPPSVVTNYVFETITNHVYHHDVVTDLTAYHTTVTNVHVHYVNENAKPTFIFPSEYDTGFVNVVAEIEGGYAVIPATWSVNYPGFTEKYGSDFSKALSKHNGKFDQRGNPMYVWQDYVAGTNPMDPSDVFHATIAIEGGQVVVSHSPVLDEARAALRKYTVYGKKNLMDSEWKVVDPGEELDYNFYRVTVRMKQSE